ncbi:MAG: DUF1569 domain-containing protein [Planctomycetota bacterium]
MTADTAERRKLEFTSIEQIEADIDHLREAGYDQRGQWPLGKICAHLAMVPEKVMDGFGFFPTWPIRPILRRTWLPKWLSEGMPSGINGPKSFMPPDTCDDDEQVARLKQTHARWTTHTDKLHPSPLFGKLDKSTWNALHFVHCNHHLSFLVPRDSKAD